MLITFIKLETIIPLMKWNIVIILVITFIVFFILFKGGDITNNAVTNIINPGIKGEEEIYYDYLEATIMDVGQGDAILVQHKDDSILIDCGEDDDKILYELTKNLKEKKIEVLILTHAHYDHVGGCDAVIKNHIIDKIIYNGEEYTSKSYETFLELSRDILEKVTQRTEKKLGEITLDIIPPIKLVKNPNDNSLITRLSFGEFDILLTGDCEQECESNLKDINSEVLKIGHHGSTTSSSLDFLDKVDAKYYVISVGENSYGHPSQLTLNKLNGNSLYRTDLNGDISFKGFVNGDVVVKIEKQASNEEIFSGL